MPSPALPTTRLFVTQLLDSLAAASPTAVEPGANPLHALPEHARKQLLTLQVLFPHEFVPALDLLDRGLVTRFHVCAADPHVRGEGDDGRGQGEDGRRQEDDGRGQGEDGRRQEDDGRGDKVESMDTSPTSQQHSTHPQPSQLANEPSTTPTVYYIRSSQPQPQPQPQHQPHNHHSRIDAPPHPHLHPPAHQVRLAPWSCTCPAFAFAAFPSTPTPTPTPPTDSTSHPAPFFGGTARSPATPPLCKHLLACVLAERCAALFAAFVLDTRVSVSEAAAWAAGWGD